MTGHRPGFTDLTRSDVLDFVWLDFVVICGDWCPSVPFRSTAPRATQVLHVYGELIDSHGISDKNLQTAARTAVRAISACSHPDLTRFIHPPRRFFLLNGGR